MSKVAKNKADRILHEANLTHLEYGKIMDRLSRDFATKDHRGDTLRVELRGGAINFVGSHVPMPREEALKMAYWLIEMLEESKEEE